MIMIEEKKILLLSQPDTKNLEILPQPKEESKQPPQTNYLLAYWNLIKNKEVIVGYYIKKEVENLVNDLDNPLFIYDTKEAHKRIKFIQKCALQSKAPYYGKPVQLMPFQLAFLEALYSFKYADTKMRRFTEALLLIARKNGKALDLNTRIPTPFGDKVLRDIEANDLVYGKDGLPVKVVATSPIFTDHDCYEVEFEDGEKIVADKEHIWSVSVPRYRQQYRNLTTEQLLKDYCKRRADNAGTEYKYRVPIPAPIAYEEKDLLIDPYILGLWLGDGYSENSAMCCGKEDIDNLTEILTDINESFHVSTEAKEIKITFGEKYFENTWHNTFKEKMKHYGLIKNKHIPKDYLYASIEQRRALLQGLMDTDGSCNRTGMCEWVQKSQRVTEDFCKLLASLGIKYSVNEHTSRCNGKNCGIAYKVIFYVDKTNSCFRLKRKHERLKDHLAPRMLEKSIVSIKAVESVPTKCLCVEGELYLCGERNTVTHNSTLMASDALFDLFIGAGGNDICCASNDDRQARLIWEEVAGMMTRLDPKKSITGKNLTELRNEFKSIKITRLSTMTQNKDGRNFAKVYLDESHDIDEENGQSEVAESCWRSMTTKDEPLFINCTTNGFNRDCYLDKKIELAKDIINGNSENLHLLAFLFLQDSEEEIWQDEASWEKSNPSIRYGVKKVQKLRQDVEDAKHDVGTRIHLLCKDFNITTSSAKGWLNIEDYKYPQEPWTLEDFRGCFCIAAADLSITTDLTNIKLLFMRPEDKTKYIFSHYWIPENKLIKADDSKAGANYKDWIKQDYITLCEGADNNLAQVAEWILNLKQKYGIMAVKVFYDQRYARDFVSKLEDAGVVTEVIQQNKYVLSTPTRLLESELKTHNINYNNNPVDEWCYSNAALEVDSSGRQQIVKMKGTFDRRIDGAVTSAILFAGYQRCKNEYERYIR